MANILIVDNHPLIGELLTEELAPEGYKVTSVGGVDSVSEKIEALEPDLVLIDLYMNRKIRWDILTAIKLHYPYLPVLIFTAYEGYGEDPRLSQADGLVIKSIDFDHIKKKLDRVLNRKPVDHAKLEVKRSFLPCNLLHDFFPSK